MSGETGGAICYGCEHCGCDPNDPEDVCFVCDDCPSDIDEREAW